MRHLIALLSVLLLALSSGTSDISGTWQGVMDGPTGKIRRIMVIAKNGPVYGVTIHSIDETDVPIVTKNVTVSGHAVTMKFDMNADPWLDYHRLYQAHLSSNGSELSGTWSIPGFKPVVMDYARVAHASWPVVEPKTTMVEVQPGVRVEVLDWGGSGRPVFLLAGAGNTGHDFFGLVPKLESRYHVYSMTRRGFGNSSKPPFTARNYSADRLGDDVVAAIDAMHLVRPVLIGHSLGGEELSDVGTRYPQKASALIYLDAGYWYAFDSGHKPADASLRADAPPELRALLGGTKSFKGPINLPILAIFAYPKNYSHLPKAYRTAQKIKENNAADDAEISGFTRGLPNAKVIRIANADHFIYVSNQTDVLRDINGFIGALPRARQRPGGSR